MPRHIGPLGAANCTLAQSGAMLTNLLSLCEVNLVLLTRVETAISRQYRQMLFFLHRLVISPEFGENISGSRASCAQKSHLKHSRPCAECSVRMLPQSIQLGHRWACIILPCAPPLYCLPAPQSHSEESHVYIPPLLQKPFIAITVCFNRENTIKLPILSTESC